MTNYQVVIYKVFLAEHGGWDYTDEKLFVSKRYTDPYEAMLESSFSEPSHPNWFATMQTIKDDEIIDVEIFDASVYTINEVGDLV